MWTTLRNTAEAGHARGAMEFFLLTTSEHGGMPASLLVSSLPLRGKSADPAKYAAWLKLRHGEGQDRKEVSMVELAAGPAVRVTSSTTLDFHVGMPGGIGYLTLCFSAPLTGISAPMEQLCDAVAGSLRWVE
ncbi:hypothetical protein [Streptomyces sp. enrichment culture]|uniref:hypothetical protein n=1 Tax=Streptomyces sp. enrichment culture TaxID=1795815 RepID=UPI003F54DCE6